MDIDISTINAERLARMPEAKLPRMGQVADLRVVAATWPWVEPMPPTVPHLDDVIDPRD